MHKCHEVVYGGGLHNKDEFSDKDLSLQQKYREEQLQNKVADCYYNHREDQFVKCYDITWNVGGNITPQNELVKQIWNNLVKSNTA